MEPKDRLAQIMQLQAGLSAAWPTLKAYLEARRGELLEKLVDGTDAKITRGRIKELKDLLELPERLEQEARDLVAPQQEAELP